MNYNHPQIGTTNHEINVGQYYQYIEGELLLDVQVEEDRSHGNHIKLVLKLFNDPDQSFIASTYWQADGNNVYPGMWRIYNPGTLLKPFSYQFSQAMEKGSENRDFCHVDNDNGLFVVADGAGKKKGSGIAAQYVISQLSGFTGKTANNPDEIKTLLQQKIRKTANDFHHAYGSDADMAGGATTFTLLYIFRGGYYIAHVGDSRCYLYRDERLHQLTNDHTIAFQQYQSGAITKEEIATHPNQKLLTRSFHAKTPVVVADFRDGPIHWLDRYLLCSDGVFKMTNDAAISGILRKKESTKTIGKRLREEILQHPLADDTSFILIGFSD